MRALVVYGAPYENRGTPLDGEDARARHWGATLGIISTFAHAA